MVIKHFWMHVNQIGYLNILVSGFFRVWTGSNEYGNTRGGVPCDVACVLSSRPRTNTVPAKRTSAARIFLEGDAEYKK